jgi:hypothetical protein
MVSNMYGSAEGAAHRYAQDNDMEDNLAEVR